MLCLAQRFAFGFAAPASMASFRWARLQSTLRVLRPPAMLRQCHSGKINAWRDSIGVLTKPGDVLGFCNGYQETNNNAGNCGSSGGTCRTLVRLDCLAAFGNSGIAICVGFGAQAHRGFFWTIAVW